MRAHERLNDAEREVRLGAALVALVDDDDLVERHAGFEEQARGAR